MANRIIIGVDIGQKQDPTAIAVAEAERREISRERSDTHYLIRHLDRLPLGTAYPKVAQHVARVADQARQRTGDTPTIYVDATGVGQPVLELILQRLPATVLLMVVQLAFAVGAGVLLGTSAARRPYSLLDNATSTVALIGYSMPVFWTGLLLILLFSVRLGWVQAGGFDGWGQGIWHGVRSLLLPAVALGLFQFAVLARTTRSALLEVLREEYVKTARAKGVAERAVLFRHALRNALIPIVTVAGVQLGQLLAGSIILESVFYLPGLGRLTLAAISARDLPVVQGVVLFVASMIVTVNAAVDILYGVLDPRIRYG